MREHPNLYYYRVILRKPFKGIYFLNPRGLGRNRVILKTPFKGIYFLDPGGLGSILRSLNPKPKNPKP